MSTKALSSLKKKLFLLIKTSRGINTNVSQHWCFWNPMYQELDPNFASSLAVWYQLIFPCKHVIPPLQNTEMSVFSIVLLINMYKNIIVNCFENFMLVSIFPNYLMPLKYNLWNEWSHFTYWITIRLLLSWNPEYFYFLLVMTNKNSNLSITQP